MQRGVQINVLDRFCPIYFIPAERMRRTLFLIPHEIASVPVFGIGWLLGLLVLAWVVRLVWAQRKHQRYSGGSNDPSDSPPSLGQTITSEASLWIAAMGLVIFVLPRVELANTAGDPVGIAIRGYGIFLVLGVTSAVLLAAYRSFRAGISPDLIYALTPWVFIGGIGGARLFYVIQYRDQFFVPSIVQTIKNVMAFTEGGLVVYGSFIGGFLTFLIFTWRHKVSVLRLGDVIVPCLFLGVFFGRIGCLLNGCCYGGRCDDNWMSLYFPPLSAVYQEQLTSGELLGMTIAAGTGAITKVDTDSVADELGIRAGDVYEAGDFDRRPFENADPGLPSEEVVPGWVMRVSGKTYRLSPKELPARALAVRPAQLISSTSSLILCALLCALSLFIRRVGALMFVGFMAYAVLRFLLEWVRVDEGGQFNTSLTISQWVSIAVFSASLIGVTWLYKKPLPEPA